MLAASAALLGLAHRLITELAAFTFCFMYITQNRYYGMWWLMIGGFWEIRDWQFPVGWSSEDYQLLSVVLYSFLGQVLSVLSSVFWLESQDHKKFFINSIWVKNKTKQNPLKELSDLKLTLVIQLFWMMNVLTCKWPICNSIN